MRRLTLRFDDKKNTAPEHKKQIATLNQRLVWWGVLDAQYAKDTKFSTKTLEAVCSFQEKRGLTIDGVVGHNTWTELLTSSSSSSKQTTEKNEENNCMSNVKPEERENLTAGIELIKQWEGLRLSVYVCPAGVPTVG